jgi:hypothetical protein
MSGIGGEGFCRDPDRPSREPVGRRALPTHEKKLATCFLPENQNLCHGVFVGANGSEYRTTRGPTERKRSAKENDRQPLDIPRNRGIDDFAGQ